MYTTIIHIILYAIEALLLLGIFETLYNEKTFILQNKIKTILFIILIIFATYWTKLHMSLVYHTPLLVVVDILLIACITKTKILDSIVIVSLFFTILLTTEYFIQIIEMFIFSINLNQTVSIPKYFWSALILSKILQIIIVILIFKFNSYFAKLRLFEKEGAIFANLIIELGIFTIFIFCINYGIFNIKNIQTYNFIIFIIYFVFLIAKFMSLKERQLALNINYKIQGQHIKHMEEIISIIRQEKHDFANHINVIQGLCLLNKPDTVEKIDKYVRGISDTIHSSFRHLDTGNDYIDGLLSIKNNYAVKNNIDFKVMINEPFSLLKIRQDELISIISNLIDNAFESFQLTSNIEHKEISIATFKENENFCIEIADNGDVIPENIIEKVFNKGFSTKTKQNDNHGFGLYITKQLVEKNNGTISVESVPEKTQFTIKFRME